MTNFRVEIRYEDPYPKKTEYREKAGKIEVAVARALRKFRSEFYKGRPIKKYEVRAELLSLSLPPEHET